MQNITVLHNIYETYCISFLLNVIRHPKGFKNPWFNPPYATCMSLFHWTQEVLTFHSLGYSASHYGWSRTHHQGCTEDPVIPKVQVNVATNNKECVSVWDNGWQPQSRGERVGCLPPQTLLQIIQIDCAINVSDDAATSNNNDCLSCGLSGQATD